MEKGLIPEPFSHIFTLLSHIFTLCLSYIHSVLPYIHPVFLIYLHVLSVVAVTDWGGANSRFLGLVSVGAARSIDQTTLRPSVIKRIRQHIQSVLAKKKLIVPGILVSGSYLISGYIE